MLKLGSLFDGIGVFPLVAAKHGIRPLWASEIEKAPISVTKQHFPYMEHVGDVTQLHGGKPPPMDVLTFGSPFQNLAQIGNRDGLSGEQSGLLYEAIRIINKMRCATDGQYPQLVIWENVAGAYSSAMGVDFRAVLEPSQTAKFQCMIAENGHTPEWYRRDAPPSLGGFGFPTFQKHPIKGARVPYGRLSRAGRPGNPF